jgi:phosphopantetheine adenylyltransferase
VVGGYIWRTVKKQGVQLFVRGIRSWEKDGADERSLQILNTWGPLLLGPLWWPIPTIFLEGKPEYNHVSSTLIRNLCRKGEESVSELSSLVPQCIVDDVVRMYGRTTNNGVQESEHGT